MKRWLDLFILLMPLFAVARPDGVILTKDSLELHSQFSLARKSYWRFHEGDSAAMALPGYDDSGWPYTSPAFYTDASDTGQGAVYSTFNGVGWFRARIYIDSPVMNTPLAISLQHLGASEIYLDGKLIGHFGLIKGKDSSVYRNPQNHPVSFSIPTAGTHVLAIRYANYNAIKNFKRYSQPFSGFVADIGKADPMFYNIIGNFETMGYFMVLLSAIFLTLFVLHMFLFLFHRVDRSNLFFSVFCLSLSAIFYIIYFNSFGKTVFLSTVLNCCFPVSISAFIISLSGFINELFGKKRLRFRIIAVLAALCVPAIPFINNGVSAIYFALSVVVLLEAIVMTIRGIARGVKGARIIGVGILFFTLFIISIFVVGVIRGSLNFNSETGEVFVWIAFLAVLSIPTSMSIYLSHNFATLNRDLSRHLKQVEELSARTLEQEQEKKRMLESQNETLEREVAARTMQVVAQKEEIELQHNELKKEKKKSDDLLLNILPAEVAEELKEKGSTKAKLFERVTVLFTDFVGFTMAGERMTPEELIDELDTCFKAFDEIISRHGIEKIKTIGDAYLAICGLPEAVPDHAGQVVMAALEINRYMKERYAAIGDKTFGIRIGIHSGSVVAGIVGIKKFAYDIWGDTVNTAARMEQHGEPGRVNISQTTYDLVNQKFSCTHRGMVEAKNKGGMNMYFIDGVKNA